VAQCAACAATIGVILLGLDALLRRALIDLA
jgi:hypothetical protein